MRRPISGGGTRTGSIQPPRYWIISSSAAAAAAAASAASASGSGIGELVDALEVDEERRRHVALRPVASHVQAIVDGVAGAPVDDGLDDGVEVELVALVGVVHADPALGPHERQLAPQPPDQHAVAAANVTDERPVVALEAPLHDPAPRRQVALAAWSHSS